MTLEERVHATLAEERPVTERSLASSARRLTERRDALHGVTGRLNLEDGGAGEVAAAALAFDTAVEGVRCGQERLRRLRSSTELGRRMERASKSAPAGDSTPPDCSGGVEASPPSGAAQLGAGTLEGLLLVANLRLDVRRDSLRRAAAVVELCPDAGDSVDLSELAARFEEAAERALALGDESRGP
jgi:hypothetical protein